MDKDLALWLQAILSQLEEQTKLLQAIADNQRTYGLVSGRRDKHAVERSN